MPRLICNGKCLDYSSPVVMGILNFTPDSFFDGGKFSSADSALKQVERMINDGASMIDIGGVSTRPNATEIDEAEEWSRLSVILPLVRKKFPDIIISVDTWRSGIATKAVNEGADMINDISGGQFDDDMFKVIAGLNVSYVMMHTQGTPSTMQLNPHYKNVTDEVLGFFTQNLKKLCNLRVTSNIVIDPGFGFGKTVEHNYSLLSNLKTFKKLGFPLLVGVSRKSMINRVLEINADSALNGTTVLNTIALLNGADILRVHDVNEAVEAVKLINFYRDAIP